MEAWHIVGINILANGGVVGIIWFIVNKIVGSGVKSMRDHCDTVTCQFRADLQSLRESRSEMWNAINTHGHKGLDGNGNNVTRTR